MAVESPRMFSVIRDGARLICHLPAYAADPGAISEQLGITTDPLAFRLSYGGQLVREGPVKPDGRLEVDGTDLQAGAYEIEVLGRSKKDQSAKEIWKQLVFFQPRQRRSPEKIHELAHKHAPTLVFSRKEEYYPLALGDILRSPAIVDSTQSIKVDTVLGSRKIPLPELYDFLCHNGHAEYLLDQSFLSFRKSDFLKLHGDSQRSVVYYSYMEDEGSDRFFINYHKFYAYDPKTGIAKLLNVGPHIFDRESMTVEFDGAEQPRSIVLSGHLENQTILFLDRLKIWNTGRVRINHPDPNTATVLGHPIAMVAEGSHAIYPCAGLFHISALSELAGHVFRRILPMGPDDDDEPPELSANQVLLPPALSSGESTSYELRPMRLDLLQSEPHPDGGELYDPDTCCLVFSGYWVDVPGPSNARFPPFTRREVEIEDWTDQAYFWDWADLPDGVSQNNRAIAEAIEARLKDEPAPS